MKKLTIAALFFSAILSYGQQDTIKTEKKIEDVILVGTRAAPRTSVNTPLPIDAIDSQILQSSGQPSMDKALQYKIPSFNSTSAAVQDATSLLDPFEIRNMGASRTLVLINGKRKNTSSLLFIQNTIGKGETGADLSAIPNIAIKKVEILRDGASAQYGSDAIAGVMNVILKDKISFTEINANLGIYSKGDGFSQNLSGITGVTFGKGGFLTLGMQFQNNDYAQRSGKVSAQGDADAFGVDLNTTTNYLNKYPDANNKNVSPKKIAGSIVANFGVPISENSNIYGNATYIQKNVNSYANHRTSYWVGEFIDDSETIKNPLWNNGAGFSPTFEGDIQDLGATVGYKIKTNNNWNIDLSSTYGENDIVYTVENTFNPNYIIDKGIIQTKFKPGGFNFKHIVGNLDISKRFSDMISIGIGTEARKEFFEMYAGDEGSYYKGGAASFPGMLPINAGKFQRSNIGFYGDIAIDFTDSTLLDITGRYETYSDFGNAFVWKGSFRQKLFNNTTTFRASASTGFKAPSLHQINLSINQASFIDGVVQTEAIFANTSKEAKELVPTLTPEKSLNLTAGFGFQPTKNLSATLDFYRIDVRDRILLSSRMKGLVPSTPEREIVTSSFFINGIDTRTQGVDLVVNWKNINLASGKLGLNIAGNYNDSKILRETGNINAIKAKNSAAIPFNRMEEAIATTSRPSYKGVLGLDYSIGKFQFYLNNTLFGNAKWANDGLPNNQPYKDMNDPNNVGKDPDQTINDPYRPWNVANEGDLSYLKFLPRVVTDLNINFDINSKNSVTFNVSNIFNVLPKWKLVNVNPEDAAVGGKTYNAVTFSGRYPQSAYDSQHFSILGTQFTLGYNIKF